MLVTIGMKQPSAAFIGHKEVVQLLIDNGAELNAISGYSSPLIQASAEGHEAVVQILVEKGAHVKCRSSVGKWLLPLLEASKRGHEAVVRILAEKGAYLNTQDSSGHTPLLTSCQNSPNIPVAKTLISLGADVNSKNYDGQTPFSYVIRGNHHDIIQLLRNQ